MFDQAYSNANLMAIINSENKKGHYVVTKYFPRVAKLTGITRKRIKYNRNVKRRYKAEERTDKLIAHLDATKKSIASLKTKRDMLLEDELAKVSRIISKKNFNPILRRAGEVRSKTIYRFEDNENNFFASKMLQRSLSHLYYLKQANRNLIVQQLSVVLSNKIPKTIYRFDLKSFYESIPHRLLEGLQTDNLLTPINKRLIKTTLEQYCSITGQPSVGIPRGLGVSAFLAEYALRRIDERILELPGVIYFARYVDDFIVVFCPDPMKEADFCTMVNKVINDSGLTMSLDADKYKFIPHTTLKESFDYLGYKYVLAGNKVDVMLSSARAKKLKQRITNAFVQYHISIDTDRKKAYIKLRRRLDYLTKNTYLWNSKSNVVVGIYYSNKYLTNTCHLVGLDRYLQYQIDKYFKTGNLGSQLKKRSFINGFNNRETTNFSPRVIADILSDWE